MKPSISTRKGGKTVIKTKHSLHSHLTAPSTSISGPSSVLTEFFSPTAVPADSQGLDPFDDIPHLSTGVQPIVNPPPQQSTPAQSVLSIAPLQPKRRKKQATHDTTSTAAPAVAVAATTAPAPAAANSTTQTTHSVPTQVTPPRSNKCDFRNLELLFNSTSPPPSFAADIALPPSNLVTEYTSSDKPTPSLINPPHPELHSSGPPCQLSNALCVLFPHGPPVLSDITLATFQDSSTISPALNSPPPASSLPPATLLVGGAPQPHDNHPHHSPSQPSQQHNITSANHTILSAFSLTNNNTTSQPIAHQSQPRGRSKNVGLPPPPPTTNAPVAPEISPDAPPPPSAKVRSRATAQSSAAPRSSKRLKAQKSVPAEDSTVALVAGQTHSEVVIEQTSEPHQNRPALPPPGDGDGGGVPPPQEQPPPSIPTLHEHLSHISIDQESEDGTLPRKLATAADTSGVLTSLNYLDQLQSDLDSGLKTRLHQGHDTIALVHDSSVPHENEATMLATTGEHHQQQQQQHTTESSLAQSTASQMTINSPLITSPLLSNNVAHHTNSPPVNHLSAPASVGGGGVTYPAFQSVISMMAAPDSDKYSHGRRLMQQQLTVVSKKTPPNTTTMPPPPSSTTATTNHGATAPVAVGPSFHQKELQHRDPAYISIESSLSTPSSSSLRPPGSFDATHPYGGHYQEFNPPLQTGGGNHQLSSLHPLQHHPQPYHHQSTQHLPQQQQQQQQQPSIRSQNMFDCFQRLFTVQRELLDQRQHYDLEMQHLQQEMARLQRQMARRQDRHMQALRIIESRLIHLASAPMASSPGLDLADHTAATAVGGIDGKQQHHPLSSGSTVPSFHAQMQQYRAMQQQIWAVPGTSQHPTLEQTKWHEQTHHAQQQPQQQQQQQQPQQQSQQQHEFEPRLDSNHLQSDESLLPQLTQVAEPLSTDIQVVSNITQNQLEAKNDNNPPQLHSTTLPSVTHDSPASILLPQPPHQALLEQAVPQLEQAAAPQPAAAPSVGPTAHPPQHPAAAAAAAAADPIDTYTRLEQHYGDFRSTISEPPTIPSSSITPHLLAPSVVAPAKPNPPKRSRQVKRIGATTAAPPPPPAERQSKKETAKTKLSYNPPSLLPN